MLGATSILWDAPVETKGVSTTGETLAKELNLEKSDFVVDRQLDAFRSVHRYGGKSIANSTWKCHTHMREAQRPKLVSGSSAETVKSDRQSKSLRAKNTDFATYGAHEPGY